MAEEARSMWVFIHWGRRTEGVPSWSQTANGGNSAVRQTVLCCYFSPVWSILKVCLCCFHCTVTFNLGRFMEFCWHILTGASFSGIYRIQNEQIEAQETKNLIQEVIWVIAVNSEWRRMFSPVTPLPDECSCPGRWPVPSAWCPCSNCAHKHTPMVRASRIYDRRIIIVDWTYSSTIFLYVEISFA